ncbi:arginine--tRNA ligase 2 [Clostridium sp. CAG:762]|nr:arginine--tRNA ligase 2 [Clostridium sp. CAG:762]
MSIKQEVQEILKKSLTNLQIDYEKEIEVSIPKDKNHGDYSTNIALSLAKSLKDNPTNIANKIKNNIQSEIISKIEVLSPGFINIFISEQYLLKSINTIIKENTNYGKSNLGQGKKVNIEFVSANPTGILHLGHGRGATYGDNLARIMTFTGYDVTKEYYVNDAGNQMNNLGISIKVRYQNLYNIDATLPEDGYHGQEIIDIAKKIKEEYQDTKLNEDIPFFKKYGLNILLDKIKKDLDIYRVNFDVFSSEQSLYDRGLVEKVITKLKNDNHCYIEDGALWLKTMDYGDEKNRVLIKSDGNYTYLLPDIAYHCDKIERGFDELIDVLGADHHGYIDRLKASLEMMGKDSGILYIKILQMVRLIKDNEELKLSKRTGKTVTLSEIIEEVGVNATRYLFSSKSLDTQLDFNIDLALKQNSENPVYYIEYANARICSILKKSKNFATNIDKYQTLESQYIYNILNKLNEFKDIVETSASKKAPHIIANYVYDLASLFHTYYNQEKIVTEDIQYTSERINLLKAIQIVINNSLNLIGIIPREEM